MSIYKVRSGQNIYDIALELYGSVEGIFYLLAANEWLNMETTLKYGMEIKYSEEFAIDNSISIWLKENNIIVKNGEHTFDYLEVEPLIQAHFKEEHSDKYQELEELSPDEESMFWEMLTTPRMIIQQQGQLSGIKVILKNDTHLLIDWGDYSEPLILEGNQLLDVEHCYKSSGSHKITLYGDFECALLDLSDINGIHYPLGTIYADNFESKINISELNKLIIPT